MKLIRPHIPINVRLEVISRQLHESGRLADAMRSVASAMTPSARLAYLLRYAFGDERPHLDHEPALCLREVLDAGKGRYQPGANDPRYLLYRTKDEHRIKSLVRGDGAQLSDAAKLRKEKRRIKGHARVSVPIRSANRWPAKGSRPLRRRAR